MPENPKTIELILQRVDGVPDEEAPQNDESVTLDIEGVAAAE